MTPAKGRGDRERDTEVVEAAGGVVWRRYEGDLQVLLVHRPKYDDWSLPKGKLDPGETFEQAAEREVWEETGLRCRRGVELEESHYVDGKGRPKVVRYWVMEPTGGTFAPNDEVDEVRWLPVGAAAARLTYERDRPVLDSFERARRGKAR
jgi:8-oxo-dGTP diphosphatase